MMFCGFGTFAGMCEKMEKLTEKNPTKISAFLIILFPSYKRLIGNKVFATSMMSTIINMLGVIREKTKLSFALTASCSKPLLSLQSSAIDSLSSKKIYKALNYLMQYRRTR